MKEIKLKVDPKNIDLLLTILHNLKEDLIDSIEYEGQSTPRSQTKYQPKTGRVIYEEESGTNDRNGKYISPAAYKAKLKK